MAEDSWQGRYRGCLHAQVPVPHETGPEREGNAAGQKSEVEQMRRKERTGAAWIGRWRAAEGGAG